MGEDPPAKYISPARNVLQASEYDGRKVIKVRVMRYKTADYVPGIGPKEFLGVENLDIVVA